MRIPGNKRSQEPDDIGNRAGVFAEAVRDGDMDLAWSMLSKETRGMRMGVWATRNNIDMQNAYRAGYDLDHNLRPSMMKDFRDTVLRLWAPGGPDRPGGGPHQLHRRYSRLRLPALWRYRERKHRHPPPHDVRPGDSHALGGRAVAGGLAGVALPGNLADL